jgi:hypothetical protein
VRVGWKSESSTNSQATGSIIVPFESSYRKRQSLNGYKRISAGISFYVNCARLYEAKDYLTKPPSIRRQAFTTIISTYPTHLLVYTCLYSISLVTPHEVIQQSGPSVIQQVPTQRLPILLCKFRLLRSHNAAPIVLCQCFRRSVFYIFAQGLNHSSFQIELIA